MSLRDLIDVNARSDEALGTGVELSRHHAAWSTRELGGFARGISANAALQGVEMA
jgi:hypothetical protein